MRTRLSQFIAAFVTLSLLFIVPSMGKAAEPKPSGNGNDKEQAVKQVCEKLVAAFNAGDAAAASALFVADGELTDDAGNTHKGKEAIEALLKKFFETFPGAQVAVDAEKIRVIGSSMAVQEGVQVISTKDGKSHSNNAFTAVLSLQGDTWSYMTVQQFPEEEAVTPHDELAQLEWLVGSWLSEDPDSLVSFSCKWSEDGNFLLVDYDSRVRGESAIKSTQRIGWDPVTKRVRSWTFDSDGGFGEAVWTRVDQSWMIKSTLTVPDGSTGSATIVVQPLTDDKYSMKGLDRILGDDARPDYEITVVRKPPEPKN